MNTRFTGMCCEIVRTCYDTSGLVKIQVNTRFQNAGPRGAGIHWTYYCRLYSDHDVCIYKAMFLVDEPGQWDRFQQVTCSSMHW